MKVTKIGLGIGPCAENNWDSGGAAFAVLEGATGKIQLVLSQGAQLRILEAVEADIVESMRGASEAAYNAVEEAKGDLLLLPQD